MLIFTSEYDSLCNSPDSTCKILLIFFPQFLKNWVDRSWKTINKKWPIRKRKRTLSPRLISEKDFLKRHFYCEVYRIMGYFWKPGRIIPTIFFLNFDWNYKYFQSLVYLPVFYMFNCSFVMFLLPISMY